MHNDADTAGFDDSSEEDTEQGGSKAWRNPLSSALDDADEDAAPGSAPASHELLRDSETGIMDSHPQRMKLQMFPVEEGFEKWAQHPEVEYDAILDEHSDEEDEGEADPKVQFSSGDGLSGADSAVFSTTSGFSDEQSESLSELEELQVHSVYSLVEDVEVEVSGETVSRKLLYMTNRQARAFDVNNMQRVLDAMEINPPRLVINLSLNTFVGVRKTSAHGSCVPWSADSESSGRTSTVISHHIHAEVDAEHVLEADRRLQEFLKKCILPVATATQALILLHTDNDILALSFTKICNAHAKTMGGKLPFTVINFTPANWVYACSVTEGTLAYTLSQSSRRWKRALPKLAVTMPEEFVKMSMQDLPGGCTHYIIVEGVHGGRQDDSPLAGLKDSFVQRLSDQLPSIAIMTARAFRLDWLMDYVARGLPLLLLDSRPLPHWNQGGYSPTLEGVADDLINLNRKLVASGTVNHYDVSTLSHLHGVMTKMAADGQKATRIRNNQVSFGREDMFAIYEVLEKDIKDKKKRSKHLTNTVAKHTAPHQRTLLGQALAIFEDNKQMEERVWATWIIMCAMDSLVAVPTNTGLLLFTRLMECTLCSQSYASRLVEKKKKALEAAKDITALNEWLFDVSTEFQYHLVPNKCSSLEISASVYDGGFFGQMMRAHRIKSTSNGFLSRKRMMKGGHLFMYIAWVDPEQVKKGPKVEEMVSALLATVDSWVIPLRSKVAGRVTSKNINDDMHLGLMDLLDSPKVYSGNLSDPTQLSQLLAQVAKLGRLPDKNSIEAMRILRRCWDAVDIFSAEAERCKRIAKASYLLLLIIGVATILVTVLSMNTEWMIREQRGKYLIGLSLSGSAIAGYTTYANPAQRWMQLRGAALSLESEIWKFRARCGEYAEVLHNERDVNDTPERNLQATLDTLEEHVGKAAAVSETAFFARFELFGRVNKKSDLHKYRHGQYEGCSVRGTFGTSNRPKDNEPDDHHTPTSPEKYLSLRVEPQVRFYQKRLPRYYRFRTITEMFILLGSLSGTLFVYMEIEEWTGIISALCAAFTAWAAFHGTTRKLTRYSNSVEKIKRITLWCVHTNTEHVLYSHT